MDLKQPLYLCMGSACHQRGGYKLLPALERLLELHGLRERVELKGAFCLEACQQGRNAKFAGHLLTALTEENLAERFAAEILPRLRHA
jgi:NADH:ubiquinone oxidoreductase subunit E